MHFHGWLRGLICFCQLASGFSMTLISILFDEFCHLWEGISHILMYLSKNS